MYNNFQVMRSTCTCIYCVHFVHSDMCLCIWCVTVYHQREMFQCLNLLAPYSCTVVKSGSCFCLLQICSKAVSTSSQLAVHMKTHTEDCSSKFFKCFLCDERFKGPAEVRKHVVVHAVNGKYTCPKVG